MGKKKAKKPGRPKGPVAPRRFAFGMRGGKEWKAWLQRYATFRRKEMAEAVDEALELGAEHFGFDRPPKR